MINNLHFTQGVNTGLCNAICTLNPLAPCLIACINLFLINEFYFLLWGAVNVKSKWSLFTNVALVHIVANKKKPY